MKKNILLTLVLTLLIASFLKAQVPNGSFEDSIYVKYPTKPFEWNTPNKLFKDLSDPANSYIELYSNDDGSNPVNIISDTNTFDFDIAKGFPISGRPDSLIVWMMFDIPSTDTLVIRTKNRETGNAFGYGELRINGSESEMIRYAIKINYTSPGFADSGVIQAYVISNSTDEHSVSIESFEFVNFSGQPLGIIPNRKFNDWKMDSIVLPLGWIGRTFALAINAELSVVSEKYTTDASDGSKAMLIETKLDYGDAISGVLVPIKPDNFATYNGDVDDPEPMFSVTKKYASFAGDYKLVTTATDTAEVSVAMFSKGKIVAKKNILLTKGKVPDYQSFEIHLDYDTFTGTPDSSSIFIFSSKGGEGVVGTQLYIDNLRFLETTSLEYTLPSDISIYPNPTQGIVNLKTDQYSIEGVQVINLQGMVVKRFDFSSGGYGVQLNLSSLPSGVYTIGIRTINNTFYHKINIEK